jgi:hypothetical protein
MILAREESLLQYRSSKYRRKSWCFTKRQKGGFANCKMHNSKGDVKARRVVLVGDEGVIDCLGLVRDGQTPEWFVIRLFKMKYGIRNLV